MDFRRYSRWTEWGVIAAIVGLHLVVFAPSERPSQPNYLLLAVHDAQLLAAIVLIIGWVILGPGPLWIRLTASPALVALWFLPWNGQMQPRQTPETFVTAVFWVSVLLIGGLRALGLRIEKRTASAGRERGAQFSLLGMLAATTAIAVAIGVLEALRPTLGALSIGESLDSGGLLSIAPSLMRYGQQVRQLVVAVSVALAALGGLWVTLRPGAPWLRLAALAGLIPALSVYLTHLSNTARGLYIATAESLAIGFAGVALVAGISAIPLRMFGFRLEQHHRPTAAAVFHLMKPPSISGLAALLLLGVAIASIPWTRVSMRVVQFRDPGNINGGLMSWAIIRNGNELVPPLNVFGAWIDRRIVLDDRLWIDAFSPVPTNPFLTTTADTELLLNEEPHETNLDQP